MENYLIIANFGLSIHLEKIQQCCGPFRAEIIIDAIVAHKVSNIGCTRIVAIPELSYLVPSRIGVDQKFRFATILQAVI